MNDGCLDRVGVVVPDTDSLSIVTDCNDEIGFVNDSFLEVMDPTLFLGTGPIVAEGMNVKHERLA